MAFDDILEQVIALLKRQGRVSYRALKMRFEDIDDDLFLDSRQICIAHALFLRFNIENIYFY